MPATFMVNNPFDIPLPGLTNLRQAIDQANGAAGADTIDFDAALYLLGGGMASALLNDTLPTITDDLTIDGSNEVAGQRVTVSPNLSNVIIDVETGEPIGPLPQFRLFEVAPAAAFGGIVVTFKSVTMSGGKANNPADPNGGAIKMTGATVILDNCFVTGNQAAGNGGGLWATGNTGQLTLTNNSVVANNTAGANGGGISVTNTSLLIEDGTQVTSNTAGLGGGGIAAFANGFVGIVGIKFVSLDGSQGLVQVNNNTAVNGDGGGVLVQELNAGVLPDVDFKHTTVNGNTAIGAAPLPNGEWTSGRGGGVAAIGGLLIDSDNATSVTGNRQSAPAPTTAPFKLGVFLDPAVNIFSTFPDNANVNDNEQLP